MLRLLSAILLFSFCLGAASGRTLAELEANLPDAAAKPKPKRVLFRSDSRLVTVPKMEPPPRALSTPAPAPRGKLPLAKKPVAPTAKPRVARAEPAPVPETPARSKRSFATPLRETALRPGRTEIDFHPTSFTPYDRYLGTVKAVIAGLDPRDASMVTACELVQECRSFRYLTTDLYRADPPAVTERRRAGDCKSKALWVYDHLGDPGAYYVIGKLVQRSRTSHAWVYWRNAGRWWILDPTVRSAPIAADSVSPTRYVPYYSFSQAGAFRHNATRLMVAANGIPAVTPTAAVRERSNAVAPERVRK